MALKGGKIFQEMIEVPDKQEGGCLTGCISWLIGFAIIIGIDEPSNFFIWFYRSSSIYRCESK